MIAELNTNAKSSARNRDVQTQPTHCEAPNPYVRHIPLHARSGQVRAWAKVDTADFARVAHVRWFLTPDGVVGEVKVGGTWQRLRLDKTVLGLPPKRGPKVKHLNGDATDCTRRNLLALGHPPPPRLSPAGGAILPVAGRGSGITDVVVDLSDYDRVAQYLWYAGANGYIQARSGPFTSIQRAVLDLPRGNPFEVDHVDGDPLNNRRRNLRIVSHAQNAQNVSNHGRANRTSPYRGVSLHVKSGRWRARMKGHTLSYHATAEEAHEAVMAARAREMPYSNEERGTSDVH